jgi:hypothetical protein
MFELILLGLIVLHAILIYKGVYMAKSIAKECPEFYRHIGRPKFHYYSRPEYNFIFSYVITGTYKFEVSDSLVLSNISEYRVWFIVSLTSTVLGIVSLIFITGA